MKSHVWGILFLLFLATLAYAPALPAVKAQPAGCMVLTTVGYLPDADCDGIVDQFDNCPGVANADQRDSNRNNVGDACDLLIEEIHVNPDNHVRQGEFVHLTVRMMNNRGAALTDITLNVRNTKLGVDAAKNIPFIPAGDTATADFWIKVPKCATTTDYPLSINAAFKDPVTGATSTEVQSQTIYVDKNTVCGTASGALDNTIISVMNQVDVDQGETALLPVSITNLGDNQATYDLAVKDLGNWGTWRIDPAARMTLAAGHQDGVYLYLETEQFTSPGNKEVDLIITSGNQQTVIPVKVYVRAPMRATVPFFFIALQLIFILFLLALIIFALIIAVRYTRKRNGKNGHKVEPYYDDADEPKTIAKSSPKSVKSSTDMTILPPAKPKRKVSVENANLGKMETYY